MLTRYWQWTSEEAAAAESSLSFGPLRFRQWTDGATVPGDAVTSLPFGPLRFRAWTNASAGIPSTGGGSGGRSFRIPVDEVLERNRLLRDDDLILFVAAAFVSLN